MDTPRSFLTLLLAITYFSTFAAGHAGHGRYCDIATHRVTGKNGLFSLVCRCNGKPEMVGRSIRFLDPKKADTAAQEKLTVGCIEARKPWMENACLKNGTEFQRVASYVLKKCMNATPKNPKPQNNVPFTYRRDKCVAEFRELDVARVEALLVCACTQRPGYIVHPGVVQFITSGSPNGAAAEQKLLLKCTKEALPNLSDTCSNMPERFDLRSAQAFSVCCKRVRVLFDIEKLKCQAVVPDDINDINLTFVRSLIK